MYIVLEGRMIFEFVIAVTDLELYGALRTMPEKFEYFNFFIKPANSEDVAPGFVSCHAKIFVDKSIL